MNSMTKLYTLIDEPYLKPLYVVNPSSNRETEDHKGGYSMGVAVWRQGVTYLSGAYGIDRPNPQSTSNLVMLT